MFMEVITIESKAFKELQAKIDTIASVLAKTSSDSRAFF